MNRKLTPKQRVLKKYPQAICIPWWFGERAYLIKKTAFSEGAIGAGRTPALAWANAAGKL